MIERIKNTMRNLEKNGFEVRYFENEFSAVDSLLKDISADESVGFGGSMTVSELGIYDKLVKQGSAVYWHQKKPDDRAAELGRAATATVYLTGTNAITEDGRLVNIDGTGNRTSSMLFGHDRAYIIAGVNKIARNLDEAMIRIKNVACPKNAERLKLDTPCRHLGKCMNCDSPQRMCNATLILERQPKGVKVILYLINENLGY